MSIVISVLPDMSAPNGNWNRARTITARIMIPNIVPVFFVGMSCFGIALPMISLRDSLPAYLYSGERS